MAHTESVSESRPVVVGVDESDSARDAALWAADLAALWGAPLCLTHAVNRAGTVASSTPSWLRELGAAAERAGATPTTTEVRYGPATHQLLARSRGARLLALGSYGDVGWSGMLAGSTALPLVAECECPLVVVRGHHPGVPPPRRGPVVVGVDETDAGAQALEFAARLADIGEHRHLVVVHTYSDLVRDLAGHPHRIDAEPAELGRRGAELLDRRLRPVLRQRPELRVQQHILPDTPLRALLDHARQAWLVVVGQRRTESLTEPPVGSTSRGLIEFAPCPVTVIPPARTRTSPDPGAAGREPAGTPR
ncbi:universal stress protein [Pseudonocardia acaciae]|uniref:universal stress protein n=1 Tax=Pseudonocardia acaciae TaxID=551276 RepID=UPI0006879881|nr:universal stress protein [Pseudonocardia acaciae]